MELGTAPAATDFIKDSTEATFMADVVDASQETPVIVDFWAPWCGPCKQLMPALEAEVKNHRGAVKLVKVNVDENQMIAAQMRVQSIPAVFAFVDGRPVDGFMGGQSPAQIKEFVTKIAQMGGDDAGGIDQAIEMAEQMIADGDLDDASETFAAILEEVPDNLRAKVGLATVHAALDQAAEARALLATVPDNQANDPSVTALLAQLDLAEASAEAGETAELRAALAANADDHQARFDLATALIAAGDTEGALDELLELFRRDRDWNEAAAKTQLLKIVDSLGPKDPLGQKSRRRLSSMIFA